MDQRDITDDAADTAADRARSHYPRGLFQPAGGFRFGADTLLLAALAAGGLLKTNAGGLLKTNARGPLNGPLIGMELGCGCGAASLGLLLLRPDLDLRITGLDSGPEMVAAASANAELLGLEDLFSARLADVNAFRPAELDAGLGGHWRADFALLNPPFRLAGTGRGAASPEKNRARFEGPGGLAGFLACAARCLRPGGRLFLVHLAERLPGIFRELAQAGLAPARLIPVQGQAHKPARLALIEAVRGGRGGLSLEPALILYAPGPGGDPELSPQAAAFCPFLAVNPRRSPK